MTKTDSSKTSQQSAKKERVLVTGASGSLGFETFKSLWGRRDSSGELKYEIVVQLRPHKQNYKLFKPYMKEAKMTDFSQKGKVTGHLFTIVWGDASEEGVLSEACQKIDWLLNCMALISPMAELQPEETIAVNLTAIKTMIDSIKEQGLENHTKFINIGSVAETGDRYGTIASGRVGDPINISVFDIYSVSKVEGERLLLESGLKYWAHLRQTFIMTPNVFALEDPIMYHSPLKAQMENNTSRDAGRGMANTLDIGEESDFWCRVYNFGGGEHCRMNYYDFVRKMFLLVGIRIEKVMPRRWFALRNFHLHYFEDSHVLNEYIHNFGDSMDDYYEMVWKRLSLGLKIVAKLNNLFPPFRALVEMAAASRLKNHAKQPSGTLAWYTEKNDARIKAFYGSYEAYESIPDWGVDMPAGSDGIPLEEFKQLDHGYDESKEVLQKEDLEKAAEFRGGKFLSDSFEGDLSLPKEWECGFGHKFTLRPYTVLKAGHWCPTCEAPPWNYDQIAKKSPFFAQVWYEIHEKDEDNYYDEKCYEDVLKKR